ncbi:MAG: FAD-dependent monooxygenase [Pseudomonadota bacterium]
MQYYVDGFKPGDPDIRHDRSRVAMGSRGHALPERVDVLIAGCGPAGLCLAAQLAGMPDIETMIVDPKTGPIEKGQADGISVRSMEMFQAFGFADKVKRESCWVNETTFWMPDPSCPQHIARAGRVQDVADDQSEMPHTLMNQARVHELFLEVMRNSPSRLEPDYALAVQTLHIDTAAEDYPVTVTLERTGSERTGELVTVRARYVVGCDGARSTVRQAIGGELEGDAANQAWGVMDVLAVTDFPDIRMKCLIASATEGNLLILPREGGYLFRMYVELDKLNPEERVANRNLTDQHIVAAANRIMSPYSVDVKEVVWWSIYEIGHRLSNRFDDVPADQRESRQPRVFTAGDACHTHSPKAGQGMNVSMGDTFNLGWKLVHVLQGRADAGLLHTYAAERWLEAKRLIETDHAWARLMSAPPGESELDGSGVPRIQQQFIENLEFTGGLAVHYERSILVGATTHQHLASGQTIGKRFHSAPVVRLADARPVQLGHVAEADARWHLYAFAPARDNGEPGCPIHALSTFLADAGDSPIRRFTRADEDLDAVIDFRSIFQQGFRELNYGAMPALLQPRKGRYGLQDYEKVFCADQRNGDIFDMRGIDRTAGAMVVVRPDQYVAHVLPLNGFTLLADFFANVFLPHTRD